MVDLVLKGTGDVAGVLYQKIEGGFDKSAKAILVKDIAKFHDRQQGWLNAKIMKHITEFLYGIDILDIKGTHIIDQLLELDVLTPCSVRSSKNIFIVSDSGYRKVVRLLGGGLAWETYKEVFGDEYFKSSIIRREFRLRLDAYRGGYF